MAHKSSIVLSIFLFFVCIGNQLYSYSGNFDAVNKALGNLTHTSFLVTKITFSADIPFSAEEFFYLTNLTEQSFLNKKMIEEAYKRLMAKKRFSSIAIDITEEQGGKHLHFTLSAQWILKKIEIIGVLFGKYQYENTYTQQAGNVFDENLHEESLKSLNNFLHNQGYFDATVRDELLYSKKYKAITVKLYINRGKKYTIHSLTTTIEPTLPKEEATLFENKLSNAFPLSLITRTYSQEYIENSVQKIKTIFKDAGYSNCQIKLKKQLERTTNSIDLSFSITPGIKQLITFFGNTVFPDSFFLEQIIGNDQPDWLFSPEIIAEQISHEYYKKGYWETTINYEEIDKNVHHFNITENNKIKIESIEVKEGTQYLSEETAYFWQKFLTGPSFDLDQLDHAINELEKFYIANGFWNFNVLDRQYIKTQRSNTYKLVLFVTRDAQFFWGGVSINGYEELLSTDFFKRYQTINPDQLIPFDKHWLSEQRDYLMTHFQSLGYWFASIEPELISLDWDKNDCAPANAFKQKVVWHVNPGECVTFDKIFIRGATRLPFEHIIKEVKFAENEVWDKEKLALTRKKLKALGVFKQVQVQPYQELQQTYKKPIVISLTDDDPVEIALRAGYFVTSKNFMFKRESTPKVGATLKIKNPTNRADLLTFSTDITHFERKLNGEYKQPSFLNLSATGRVKGYANKYVHPVQIRSSGSAYEASQTGFLFGLNDEYKKDYFWALNFGNEWIKTTRVRGSINLDPSMIDKTLSYLFIEPSLTINKLDDPLNTTQGLYSQISTKIMAPHNGGNFSMRIMGEHSYFHPLKKNIVAAMRLRAGHVLRRSFSYLMPIERFYLGGPSSVRGYEHDAIPPLGVQQLPDNSYEYTIQGGGSMFNANFELRFPLYTSLNGVVFQDIGTLSQQGLFGLTKTWYPATGIGLRYKTPIGSIRFDIGWKWKKRFKDDSRYAWYLTLGEAF